MNQVRDLTVNDVFAIAKILGKVAKGSRAQLIMVLSDKAKDIAPVDLGLTLFQTLCIDAEADVKAWLADMAGMKAEEFGKLPPENLIDVIEQIASKDGIKDFLARAASLAGKVMPKKSTEQSIPSSEDTAGQTV